MSAAKDSASSAEKGSKHRRSRLPGSILAVFGGMTMLMITGVGCFYFLYVKAAKGPVDMMAEALSGVFGTEVVVSGSTAVLAKSEIGELALVQRKTQAFTKFQTTWMGSEKTLIVRADFVVKAGFDLSEGGQWGILDGKIEAINRLSPQDHARAFNYLKNQARQDAQRSDIGKEAERVLLRRISDRMGAAGEGLTWQDGVLP
jgi:hypothetical protein